MPTAPDRAAVKAYLDPSSSWPDDQIDAELAAETVAQARVCRIPADPDPASPQPYPADLAKALCRRVARALNMRQKPLGYEAGLEGGLSYISANDSEIRRLESPFRRRPVR
jgi:hypothetical protein